MAEEKLIVKIEGDSTGLKVEINGVVKSLNSLDQSMKRSNSNVVKAAKAQNSLTDSFRRTVVGLSSLQTLFYQYSFFLGGFITSVVKANAEMEKLNVLMRGMASSMTEAGRADDAKKSLQYVRDLAKEAPFSLQTLTDSFIKFKSGGIDPMDGGLKALVDSVARFGGSDDQLQRAAVAIQQMAGKGVVSMEELRQQLGEAVPTAARDMARGLGLSMKDMVKYISDGKVKAGPALEAMFDQMKRSSSGSAEAMMSTFNGLFTRLKTAFFDFANQVSGYNTSTGAFSENGFFGTMKKQVQELTEFLNSADGKRFAEELGNGISTVVKALSDLIKLIYQYKDEIKAAAQVAIAIFAGKQAIALAGLGIRFGGLIVDIYKVGMALTGARGALLATAAASKILSGSLFTLGGRFNFAATAAGTFTGRLMMLAARASIIIGGLALIAIGVNKLYHAYNSAANAADQLSAAQERQKNGEISTAKQLADQQASADRLRTKLNQKYKSGTFKFFQQNPEASGAKEYFADLKKQEQLYTTTMKSIEDQKVARVNAIQEETYTKMSIALERKSEVFNKNLAARREKEIKAYEDGGKVTVEGMQAINNKYDKMAANWYEGVGNNIAKMAAGQSDNVKAAYEKLGKETLDKAKEFKQLADKTPLTSADWLMTDQTEKGKKKADKSDGLDGLRNRLTNLMVQSEELKQHLAGVDDPDLWDFEEATRNTNDLIKNETSLRKSISETIAEIKKQKQEMKDKEALSDLNNILKDQTIQARIAFDEFARGYDKLNLSVERYQEKLKDKFAPQLSSKDAATAAAAQKKVIEATAQYRKELYFQEAEQIRDRNEQIITSLMTEDQLREYNYRKEVARVQALIAMNKGETEEERQAREKMEEYLDNLGKKRATDRRAILINWAKDAANINDNIQKSMTGLMDGFIDDLVEGKASFAEFAKSIVKDLIKIILKAMIARAILAALGQAQGSASLSGIQAGGMSTVETINGQAAMPFPVNHMGGIAGRTGATRLADPSIFKFAQRYHTGGIAGLRPNEVPIIAEKDEGIFTKSQMKALGNGTKTASVGDVEVNIINQSGTQVDASQQQSRWDGAKYIVDVVLNAAITPGPLRDHFEGLRSNK